MVKTKYAIIESQEMQIHDISYLQKKVKPLHLMIDETIIERVAEFNFLGQTFSYIKMDKINIDKEAMNFLGN